MINIHDALKARENQISSLQMQISVVQKEIEALRIAVRILERDSVVASETISATSVPVTPTPAGAVPVSTLAAASPGGTEKPSVWP